MVIRLGKIVPLWFKVNVNIILLCSGWTLFSVFYSLNIVTIFFFFFYEIVRFILVYCVKRLVGLGKLTELRDDNIEKMKVNRILVQRLRFADETVMNADSE